MFLISRAIISPNLDFFAFLVNSDDFFEGYGLYSSVKYTYCTNIYYFVAEVNRLRENIPRPARAVQTRAASYGMITFFTIY